MSSLHTATKSSPLTQQRLKRSQDKGKDEGKTVMVDLILLYLGKKEKKLGGRSNTPA